MGTVTQSYKPKNLSSRPIRFTDTAMMSLLVQCVSMLLLRPKLERLRIINQSFLHGF